MELTALDQAYAAGFTASMLGRRSTSYPSCYTQAEITEWYSGYDKACEELASETAANNRANW